MLTYVILQTYNFVELSSLYDSPVHRSLVQCALFRIFLFEYISEVATEQTAQLHVIMLRRHYCASN